jgi:hypothetical protein
MIPPITNRKDFSFSTVKVLVAQLTFSDLRETSAAKGWLYLKRRIRKNPHLKREERNQRGKINFSFSYKL